MAKKRNTIIKILLVLAVVFVLFNAIRAEYSPYVKQFARTGTYINSVEAKVILVRNETIVNPGMKGVYESYITEGERVPTGGSLGAIVTGEIDEEKMNELNRLNAQIEEVTNSISEAGVLSIPDEKVETTLSLSVNNLRYAASKNDAETAVKLVKDIRILTDRKAGVTTSSSAQEELNNLTLRRDEITRSLGGTHQRIFAPVYGQYSNKLDGLETVLTYDKVKKATVESVDAYFDMLRTEQPITGVCKVVNNYDWHIIFTLTEKEAEGLKVGKEYECSFKDLGEKRLDGMVKYISELSEDGRYAIIMEFNNYLENFTYARSTRVEICKEKYSGIYIPSSALRVVDGALGVWVQNEISLDFRSIETAFRTDDFVLAKEDAIGVGNYKNIMLYDNIVLNPDDK